MKKLLNSTLLRVVFISIICSTIFFLNTARLRSWIVDDAGISFSYSRSLAEGYGLVAQPGAERVEGFSNPTWVFLFSLIKLLGFDILAAAKSIGFVFSVGVILFSALIAYKITHNILISFIGLCWIVLQPGLIIWFSSGLENPLYVFLILLLIWLTLKEQSTKVSILAGLAAALIGLTRPEGFLFMIGFLIIRPKSWKPYLISFCMLFGAYFVFRLAYYGYPLPNTFYMKIGNRFQLDLLFRQIYFNIRVLGNGILGKIGFWIFLILSPALFVLIIKTKIYKKPNLTIYVFAALALFTYIFLPPDWMGELRFASPILALFPILLISIVSPIVDSNKTIISKPIRVISILILIVWITTNYFSDYQPRLATFSEAPTVDLKSVQASAQVYTQAAEIINLEDYAVLQADVGGALWLNRYQVVDLGGLVDGTIARTLGQNQSAFHEYIFDEIKPEMIELHGKWALRADLPSDERFDAEYRAIYSFADPSGTTINGQPVINGFFVRKDLILSDEQFILLENTIVP